MRREVNRALSFPEKSLGAGNEELNNAQEILELENHNESEQRFHVGSGL